MAKPLQEMAYDYLENQIKSGVLQPGVVYSETRMCRELNISRTPFKDALVRLSQDKYIDILPSRGFQLHRITEQDIRDTCQVRTAIESFCLLHLLRCQHQPSGRLVLRQLGHLMDQMQEAMAAGQADEFLQLDIRFHETLVHYPENREFTRLFASYVHQISYLASQSLSVPHRMEATLEEHQAMLAAVADENPAAAGQAVERHMEFSLEINLRQLQEGTL